MDLKAAIILDAKGLARPMPIVKTQKAMEQLEPGKVIEVQATDRGSELIFKHGRRVQGIVFRNLKRRQHPPPFSSEITDG